MDCTTPLAAQSLNKVEFSGKKDERIGRYEEQQIEQIKVLGPPMASELTSMIQSSGIFCN